MPTQQEYATPDVLRLLVERDPVGSELVNRLPNPDGELGGWGWRTPVTNSGMTRAPGSTVALQFLNTVAQATLFTSPPIYMSAGEWVAARWVVLASTGTGFHRGRFEFYTETGMLISSGAQTNYLDNGTASTRVIAATTAPATTAYARLRVDMYGNNSGAVASIGDLVRFNDAAVAVASSSGALASFGSASVPTAYWTNVLPDATALDVNRTSLNASTLNPRIQSAALDLVTSTTLRPGHQVRLEALVSGTWEPIYTGRTGDGASEYVINRDRARVDTFVNPVAYDAAAILARTPVATVGIDGFDGHVGGIRDVLEAAVTPVPWLLNGSTGQSSATLSTGGTDPQAKLLDWIVRARDSIQGSGWVSRRGVLVLRDKATHDAAPTVDTITDGDYNSQLVVGYDTQDAINTVTITNNVGGTSTTYGPYRHATSIRRWGEQSATFTTYGLSAGQVAALGSAILAANREPALVPRSATIALSTTALVNRWALRDVGDKLRITCTTPAIDTYVRIVGIRHQVTPASPTYPDGAWYVRFQFALEGRAALPTV